MHGPDQRRVRGTRAPHRDHGVASRAPAFEHPAFQHCGEEASVPWRFGVSDKYGPGPGGPSRTSRPGPGAPRKIRMTSQERVHLRLILFQKQRARCEHQPSARPHQLAASSRIIACLGSSSSRSIGLNRVRASGLRRQVPVPVQGASTSTRSKVPARRLVHLVAGVRSDGARHCGRGPAQPPHRPLQPPVMDVAGDDMAVIFHGHGDGQGLAPCPGAPIGPPASAARRRPGRRPTGCPRPGSRPARTGTPHPSSPRGGRRSAGPRGTTGWACRAMPSAASAASACSRVAFSRLMRRSSGAGASMAASSASSAGPNRAARWGQQPIGHFQPDGLRHLRMVERVALQRGGGAGFQRQHRGGTELAAGIGLRHAGRGPSLQQQRSRDQHPRRGRGAGPAPATKSAAAGHAARARRGRTPRDGRRCR